MENGAPCKRWGSKYRIMKKSSGILKNLNFKALKLKFISGYVIGDISHKRRSAFEINKEIFGSSDGKAELNIFVFRGKKLILLVVREVSWESWLYVSCN